MANDAPLLGLGACGNGAARAGDVDRLLTPGDYDRDPDGRPDLDAIRSNIAIERKLGYVKEAAARLH